jgi:hypothetical protein
VQGDRVDTLLCDEPGGEDTVESTGKQTDRL